MQGAYGDTVTGYAGTVQFTSSDAQVALTTTYLFQAIDNGCHTFTVTLETSGGQTVTATDTETKSK